MRNHSHKHGIAKTLLLDVEKNELGVKTKFILSNINEFKLYVEVKEQNMNSIHCKVLFD